MEAHTAAAFDEVGIPRLVMAGAGSGTGKTSITCGVVSALRRRGRGVRSFKVGPDFADAGYLGGVAGVPCRSLDLWLLGRDRVLQSFHRGCVEGDIAVVEGMLGLLDSWGGDSDSSTATTTAPNRFTLQIVRRQIF